MKLRRLAYIVLATVLPALPLPPAAAAGGGTAVFTVEAPASAAPGGEFEAGVLLQLPPGADAGGIWAGLYYDSGAFALVSVAAGPQFPSAMIGGSDGEIVFTWESIQPVAQAAVLFTARFRVCAGAAEGPSVLTADCQELYDGTTGMNDIPCLIENAAVWVGERLALSEERLELFAGESSFLAANKPVDRWESADERVAAVGPDGKVTAVGAGQTRISAHRGILETAVAEVAVTAVQLTGIRIKTMPVKLVYEQGAQFDPTGMAVELLYNSGLVRTADGGVTWQYDFSQPGVKTVSVFYGGKQTSLTVTVTPKPPPSIASSVYSAQNGFLSKIPAGTTAAYLLARLNEPARIRIYNAANAEISGGAVVGTGMSVRLLDGARVVQSLTAVVTGDVNGDGQITLTDYARMKAHTLKKETLSASYLKAADVNGDGQFTLTDYAKMKAHLLKKETITPRAY